MKKALIIVAAVIFLLALTVVITIDLVQKRDATPAPRVENAPQPNQPVQAPADAEQRRRDEAALAAARVAANEVVGVGQQPVVAPAEPPKHNLVLQGTAGIFDIVLKGDMEALRALVEARPASVHDKDQLSDSPLHHAVGRNRADMVDFLLSYKADIHAKNVQGETPLHTAAGAGLTDMVRLLLHHGADVNIRDGKMGLTPMTWAILFGRTEVVELLRKHGAKE